MRMNEKHECRDKVSSKLCQIGMSAGMNHVTVKALRYCDEQSLLKPAYAGAFTGYTASGFGLDRHESII